ncbi:hypothetical protein GUJ93_ZPchr0005g14647 [Zizania palustris]|uniref:Uncharacterized protein n=1 Tax=Zizania palustris TaxID=103762 RepID=A0A8J5SHX4_ZIZPA|nr:hypothetical protein GUJ93_ZPchr0005g14647 [Zizania palustris]
MWGSVDPLVAALARGERDRFGEHGRCGLTMAALACVTKVTMAEVMMLAFLGGTGRISWYRMLIFITKSRLKKSIASFQFQ